MPRVGGAPDDVVPPGRNDADFINYFQWLCSRAAPAMPLQDAGGRTGATPANAKNVRLGAKNRFSGFEHPEKKR
jgi:hypothetical protein